jgi:hypothetical protein
MNQLQFLATVLAVTLLFVAGGALGSVFTLWLSDRPDRGRKPATPRPRAENRNKQVTAPAHPVPVPVVCQEVTRLPVLDGDITEVRERTDPTRLDLMKHHTAWGPQARGGRAS